jgi:formamidopyrimidine-DNA glycosylase
MPELPDLTIVAEILSRHLAARRITAACEMRPLVVRPLRYGDTAASFLVGRAVAGVRPRGKFLLLALDGGTAVAVNCMLAGRLRLCPPNDRPRVRDYFAATFAGDDGPPLDLRYHDVKGMGKVYLTPDPALIPGFSELGPDALDPALTAEEFAARLRRFTGEIKGILTREGLVAGIGNAYADEILFRAGLYPFRKRPSLSAIEIAGLYAAMRAVLSEAVETLRMRMGDDPETELRDFLQVHNRVGQPCPRCGHPISRVTLAQRFTDFCRECQPGTLVRR